MSVPISAITFSAVRVSNPRIVRSGSTAAAKGPSFTSIAPDSVSI
ncbi:MAG: hypothetical protein ACLPZR_31670 [Solirubrobacteraceae bacterium]